MTKYSLTLSLAFLTVGSSAFGTPTGLNNIPTADTVPHRTVAVQYFNSFGGANQFGTSEPGKPGHWLGFKTGWEFEPVHIEWGADSLLGTGVSGPLFLQGKARFSPWEQGMFAIGTAGIALTNLDRAGDPFSYAMLAHDFGVARLHAGYGYQTNGSSYLFGIDRTWKFIERNFNVNADLAQTRDQHGFIAAVGAKYELTKHVVLETWGNIPDRGAASVITKINLVFSF
jgi:hypothetical protein